MNKEFIFKTVRTFVFDLFAHTKRSFLNKFKVELVSKFTAQANTKVVTIIFISCLFSSSQLLAASIGQSVNKGNKLFKKGQFDEAIKNYEEALKNSPESAIGNFNAGAALYKQQQYKESIEHTQKVLLSEDKNIQQKAYYNLGNAYYKWGMSQEEKDISSAIQKLQRSLSHYEKALSIEKDDQDARLNYEFVKKELEKLKKEQTQSNQNKQKSNSENKENDQPQSSAQNKEDQSSSQSEKKQQRGSEAENNQKQSESPQGNNSEQKSTEEGAKQEQADYNKSSEGGSLNDQGKELTAQEAQMLLKNYEATEEPKGLFKIFRSQGELKDAQKDW